MGNRWFYENFLHFEEKKFGSWILTNFKNLEFFADSAQHFPSLLLKLHSRVLRRVPLKEKNGNNGKSKNFPQTSSNFFENVFRTALNMSAEAFSADFAKLHFSRNFAVSLYAMVSKKQSSCPEKELWKTKFEKGSKIKQLFSDFVQKRVGRLVKTGSYVLRGIFWKVFRETQYLMFSFIVLREISWILIDKLFAGFNKTSVF